MFVYLEFLSLLNSQRVGRGCDGQFSRPEKISVRRDNLPGADGNHQP